MAGSIGGSSGVRPVGPARNNARHTTPGSSGLLALARRGNNLFFYPSGRTSAQANQAHRALVAPGAHGGEPSAALVFPSLDTEVNALIDPFGFVSDMEALPYVEGMTFSPEAKREASASVHGGSGSYRIPLTLKNPNQSPAVSLAELQLKLLLTQIGLRGLSPKTSNPEVVLKFLNENYTLISNFVDPLIAKLRKNPGDLGLKVEFFTLRHILKNWDKDHPIEADQRVEFAREISQIKAKMTNAKLSETRALTESSGRDTLSLFGRPAKRAEVPSLGAKSQDRLGEDMTQVPGIGDDTKGVEGMGEDHKPDPIGDDVAEVEIDEVPEEVEVANFGIGNWWNNAMGNWGKLEEKADNGDDGAKNKLIDNLINKPERFDEADRERLLIKYAGQDPAVLQRFLDSNPSKEILIKLFESGVRGVLGKLFEIGKTGDPTVFDYLINYAEQNDDRALMIMLIESSHTSTRASLDDYYLSATQINRLRFVVRDRIREGDTDLLREHYIDLLKLLRDTEFKNYRDDLDFMYELIRSSVDGALRELFNIVNFIVDNTANHQRHGFFPDDLINELLNLEAEDPYSVAGNILGLMDQRTTRVADLRAERLVPNMTARLRASTDGRLTDADLAIIAEAPRPFLREKLIVQAILERFHEGNEVARDILGSLDLFNVNQFFGVGRGSQTEADREYLGYYGDYLVEMITKHGRHDLLKNLVGDISRRIHLDGEAHNQRVRQVVEYFKNRIETSGSNSRADLITLFNIGPLGWKAIQEISEGASAAQGFALELVTAYTRFQDVRRSGGFGPPIGTMEGLLDISNLNNNPFAFSSGDMKYVIIRDGNGDIQVHIGGSHHRNLFLNEGDAIAAGFIVYNVGTNTITINGGSTDFPTDENGITNRSRGSYPLAREDAGLNAAAEYLRGRFPGVTVEIQLPRR